MRGRSLRRAGELRGRLACREDADCRRGPLARCVARCCELAATELVVEDCQIKLSGRFDWEPGRHHVLPRYAGLLDELARLLAAHEDVRLSIDVHIDQQGSDRYGHSPTRRRADNIRRYLVEQGIAPERLVTRGFGEEVPLESNETPEGRARNRRGRVLDPGLPAAAPVRPSS
ncbi:MAG: OmpA family protein [Myxococcales bacterium]|nr:OmpA family protein [Myxococcales bacterium]